MTTDAKTVRIFSCKLDGAEAAVKLTKAELVETLSDQLGLSKREAKDFVDSFIEEICNCLENGEDVKLWGFGNFELRDRNVLVGRHPKTGVEINLKPRRVVSFRSSQVFRSRIPGRSLA